MDPLIENGKQPILPPLNSNSLCCNDFGTAERIEVHDLIELIERRGICLREREREKGLQGLRNNLI